MKNGLMLQIDPIETPSGVVIDLLWVRPTQADDGTPIGVAVHYGRRVNDRQRFFDVDLLTYFEHRSLCGVYDPVTNAWDWEKLGIVLDHVDRRYGVVRDEDVLVSRQDETVISLNTAPAYGDCEKEFLTSPKTIWGNV